jgi:hypothetical protein
VSIFKVEEPVRAQAVVNAADLKTRAAGRDRQTAVAGRAATSGSAINGNSVQQPAMALAEHDWQSF